MKSWHPPLFRHSVYWSGQWAFQEFRAPVPAQDRTFSQNRYARRQTPGTFSETDCLLRHNHRHSGMLISTFHRRMAYPHTGHIRNFVSRSAFMMSDPISVIADSLLSHPVSSSFYDVLPEFFSSRKYRHKKRLRRYIFLSLYALFSLLSIPLPTIFLLFFIFFPFLLEFGHTLLTYSFYNKARIVDKPLTISPPHKKMAIYFCISSSLFLLTKTPPDGKRNHFRFPPGGILSSFCSGSAAASSASASAIACSYCFRIMV